MSPSILKKNIHDIKLLPQNYKLLKIMNPYTQNTLFLKQAVKLIKIIPQNLQTKLLKFKLYGNKSGYFLIKKLPLDPSLKNNHSCNQINQSPPIKKTFYSELWLAIISFILGEPFSYQQEGEGFLFHNIYPEKKHKNSLSSKSANILLDFHTETAFHSFIPDFLLLFCLRQDRHQQAKTFTASLRNIYHSLPKVIKKYLFKPWFKTGIDTSFGSPNRQQGNGPIIPILSGNYQDPLMTFDPDLMKPLNDKAALAITSLQQKLLQVKQSILLKTGDLLIIDNRRAVHGRNQFKAYFDGQDRWLQRCYVTKDFTKAELLFNQATRIINHRFF